MSKLYRVTVKETRSVQPSGTFWNREVLYCGYDRDEARQAYHASTPDDFWRGYGSSARETELEVITDAETDDFSDDEVSQEQAEEAR